MRIYALIFFAGCFFAQCVNAQVVDMRAFSRQRGFKAYQAKPTYAPAPKAVQSIMVHGQNRTDKADEKQAAFAEQDKIQQTGVKIFQEKDENKVLNFDVENPEFDKLSESRKKDLTSRITFEKNTD